jgi:hypothetical protein
MTLFGPEDECIVRIHEAIEHLRDIDPRRQALGVDPDRSLTAARIAELVEVAFWAGMRVDEGRATRVRIAVADPSVLAQATSFVDPPVYDEPAIAKLAPAVPTRGCVAVAALGAPGRFRLWGFSRTLPRWDWSSLILELREPGTVVVSVGPFRPFAVLDGRANAVIEGSSTDLAWHLQHVLSKPIPADGGPETQAVWGECLALAHVTREIHSAHHGGLVLLTPDESGDWQESINPFAYRLTTPDTGVRDAIRSGPEEEGKVLGLLSDGGVSGEPLMRVVAAMRPEWIGWEDAVPPIAALAAVDGAIVLTRDVRVLGFGAMINVGRREHPPVAMFDMAYGLQPVVRLPIERLGGTRHQSAARFVGTHRDVVAIVISQDGRVSVMHWDSELALVSVVRNAEWWI